MKTLEEALAAIEDMKAAHEAEKTAILNKNKELIEREKKAKAAEDAAREAAEEAAAEKDRESKDVAAIEKRLADKHAKDLKKLQDQLADREGLVSKMLIDNGIQAALAKHQIDPVHHEILRDAFKAKAKLDGDRALIGDAEIDDYIGTFAASDVGKRYIAAPNNSGAAATGSKATGQVVPETWNLTKYVEMKTSSPELAQTYAAKFNKRFD